MKILIACIGAALLLPPAFAQPVLGVNSTNTFTSTQYLYDSSTPTNATAFYGAGPTYPTYSSFTIGQQAFANYVQFAKYHQGLSVYGICPNGGNFGSVTCMAAAFYGANGSNSGTAFGLLGIGLSLNVNQKTWGGNFVGSNCDHKDVGDPNVTVTCYVSSPIAVEFNTTNGSQNVPYNFHAFVDRNQGFPQFQALGGNDFGTYVGTAAGKCIFAGTEARAASLNCSGVNAPPAAPVYNGTNGLNDVTFPSGATYTWDQPLKWLFKITAGAPDTYQYTETASMVGGVVQTGADLVLGAGGTSATTTVSHWFDAGDVYNVSTNPTTIDITGGAGCTIQAGVQIQTTAAGAITLTNVSMGTLGSKCTYVMWRNAATSIVAGGLIQLTLPADTDAGTYSGNVVASAFGLQYSNGLPARSLATNHGVSLTVAASTGHCTDAAATCAWTFLTPGVPTIHVGHEIGPGAVDIGTQFLPLDGGPNQPSAPLEFCSANGTLTAAGKQTLRCSDLFSQHQTSGNLTTVTWINGSDSGFHGLQQATSVTCYQNPASCTEKWKFDNFGNLALTAGTVTSGGNQAVDATGALTTGTGGISPVYSTYGSATIAQINSGLNIVPDKAGRTIKIIHFFLQAIGGAVATCTAVQVQDTAAVVGASVVVAALTQNTVVSEASGSNVTLTTFISPMTAGKGLQLAKTGSSCATATSVNYEVNYTY